MSSLYQLPEHEDRLLRLMDATLKIFTENSKTRCVSMCADDAQEIIEICAEGVAKMEMASLGIAPLQRVMVGAQYTLNALKEWREHGPLHNALEES